MDGTLVIAASLELKRRGTWHKKATKEAADGNAERRALLHACEEVGSQFHTPLAGTREELLPQSHYIGSR